MNLPEEINLILDELNRLGYKTYLVGGAPRDYLLGGDISDYDLASSARPDEISLIFPNIQKDYVNNHIPTTILNFNGVNIVISTFRTERYYKVNGIPSVIEYTELVYKDLYRRDFTINSLIYNNQEGFVDYLDSIEDFKQKKIRTIGNSRIKVKEDPLRILRAIRLASQTNFSIDNNLKEAIEENRGRLKYLSNFVINREIKKILDSNYYMKGLNYLLDLGLFKTILIEKFNIQKYIKLDLTTIEKFVKDSIKILDNKPHPLEFKAIFILYNMYTELSRLGIYKNMGDYIVTIQALSINEDISKDKLKSIGKLLLLTDSLQVNDSEIYLKRLMKIHGYEDVKKSINLRYFKSMALETVPEISIDYLKMENLLEDIRQSGQVYLIKDLNINGNDIINLGIAEGKEIGYILEEICQLIIEDKLKNTKQSIISYIERMIK